MTAPIIRMDRVSRRFGNRVRGVSDMSLTIKKGELVSFLGPSGCGRSRGRKMINGLQPVGVGTVNITPPQVKSEQDLESVFQDPTPMSWATMPDSVFPPLRLSGASRGKAAPRVQTAPAEGGLTRFAGSYPREQSGGMKARVVLVRTMVTRPRILLRDEPFAALDEMTQREFINDLARLAREHGLTVALETRSVFEAVYHPTRAIVMAARPGGLVADLALTTPLLRGEDWRISPEVTAEAGRHTKTLEGPLDVARSSTDTGAPENAELTARLERSRMLARLMPILTVALAMAAWAWVVRHDEIAKFLITAPNPIALTLETDAPSMLVSAWLTTMLTALPLGLDNMGVVPLGALFALSWVVGMSPFPFAVILQVAPGVAIAPLIHVDRTFAALPICAWIAAFFAILWGAVVGFPWTDHNLHDLSTHHRATPWQRLRRLQLTFAPTPVQRGLAGGGGAVTDRLGHGGVRGGRGWAEYGAVQPDHRTVVSKRDPADICGTGAGLCPEGAMVLLKSGASRRVQERSHEREVDHAH